MSSKDCALMHSGWALLACRDVALHRFSICNVQPSPCRSMNCSTSTRVGNAGIAPGLVQVNAPTALANVSALCIYAPFTKTGRQRRRTGYCAAQGDVTSFTRGVVNGVHNVEHVVRQLAGGAVWSS